MPIIKVRRDWKELITEKQHEKRCEGTITRRDLLARGLSVGVGTYLLPSWLTPSQAFGANCPQISPNPIGMVTIDLDSGPTWTGDYGFPTGPDGQPIQGADFAANASKWGISPTATPIRFGNGGTWLNSESHFTRRLQAGIAQLGLTGAPWTAMLANCSFFCHSVNRQDDGGGQTEPATPYALMQLLKSAEFNSVFSRRDQLQPVAFFRSPARVNVQNNTQSFINAVTPTSANLTSDPLMDLSLRSAASQGMSLFESFLAGKAKGEETHVKVACALDESRTKGIAYRQGLFTLTQQAELKQIGGVAITDAQLTGAPAEMQVALLGSFRSAMGTIAGFITQVNGMDNHAQNAATIQQTLTDVCETVKYAIAGIHASGKPGIIFLRGAGSASANGTTVATGTTNDTLAASTNQADNGNQGTWYLAIAVVSGSGGIAAKNIGWIDATTGSTNLKGPLQGRVDLCALSDTIALAHLGGLDMSKLYNVARDTGLVINPGQFDALNPFK